MSAIPSLFGRCRIRAFVPVDNASLVFFRFAFGLLMAWETYRYFKNDWIFAYWIKPKFFFHYYGFSWLNPWPGDGMYLHWFILGLLAVFLALGLFYRLSALLFFLGFTYCFLLGQAHYLNHFYLVCLLSFLLIFLPAHRAASLDCLLRPRLRASTTPAWTIWILRLQIGVVYFYSGIAKLSPGWVSGGTMRPWLAQAQEKASPIVGRFFHHDGVVYFASYSGLLFDLLVVPALLWRRTRLPAFACAVAFHLANAHLFQIGIFPWLAIAATTIFFAPDWPRLLLARCGISDRLHTNPALPGVLPRYSAVTLSFLALYAALQLLVPLRHHLYPSRVDWSYEGHRFSWRMKLLDRKAYARFIVVDENTGATMEVRQADYLTPRQTRKMAARPDMILQFAHHLAAKHPVSEPRRLRVHAIVFLSLNDGPPQLLVDPEVNLAAVARTLGPASWLLPLPETSSSSAPDQPALRLPEAAPRT